MKKPTSGIAFQPLYYLGLSQWRLFEPTPRELFVDMVATELLLDTLEKKD